MKPSSVFAAFLSLALAAVLVAGCGNQMEPARKAIADIEAAVTAAGPDATKYIPDQVKAVTGQVSDLRARFEQKDYKGIVAAAPALLAQAQALAPAAAAKKAEVMAALPASWTELSASVPAVIATLEGRLAEIAKAGALPGGVDAATIEAAQRTVAMSKGLWTKANEMQAAGQLEQAVAVGKYIKDTAGAMLAKLGAPAG